MVKILEYVGVRYKALNVYDSTELRQGIKIYSDWPTIPQLYVKGEFVGGCDIVGEMFQVGELQQLFIEKDLPSFSRRTDNPSLLRAVVSGTLQPQAS